MYTTVTIPTQRYCNLEELTGFIELPKVLESKPLHPALPENKQLHNNIIKNLNKLHLDHPFIHTGHTHFLLPADRINLPSPQDYKQTNEPQPLKSVFATWYLLPKKDLQQPNAEFLINQSTIPPLDAKVNRQSTSTIYSNLGYFVTPELIHFSRLKSTEWAFNKRYPQFSIEIDASPAIGFYYVKQQNKTYSTVVDFPRGCIGITTDGTITILNTISIDSYTFEINNSQFTIHDQHINALNQIGKKITLITPSIQTKLSRQYQAEIETSLWETNSWIHYKEIISAPDTYNIFISNQGNGTYPIDIIAAVWKDKFPIVPFGYIISIPQSQMAKIFGPISTNDLLNQSINVTPQSKKINFENFQTIYSAAIPLISGEKYQFESLNAYQIMQHMNLLGSFTHPNIQLSLESKNFSPVIRDASNIAIETENYIGNILFSGRFELSIGASLIDQPILLKMIEKTLPEPFKNALMLDDGSGTKAVYAPDNTTLLPLNITSAGFRNPLGDPSGNYYFSLTLPQ